MYLKRTIFAMALVLILVAVGTVEAAEVQAIPEPNKVILSPQSARAQGIAKLTVQINDGHPVLLLSLPQEALEVGVTLGGDKTKALRAWSTEQVPLPEASGSNARARAALLAESDMLFGLQESLDARMALLSAPPSDSQPVTPAQMEQRLRGIQELLPPLAAEKARVQRQWEALQQRLATLPDTARRATLVVMDVPTLKAGTTVDVHYAYTLRQCGWTPFYTFDARPADNTVAVRLLADVWQYSGVDWSKSQIVLSTQQSGQREPQGLHPWLAQKGRIDARPMAKMERSAQPMALMATKADNAAPAPAGPEEFEGAGLSGWNLNQGLGEGRTRVPVLEENWKAPLQRLARPTQGGQVWLTARQSLEGKNLPAGEAVYLLEGSAVGSGRFSAPNAEAVLYFGADPLVSVQITPDTRMTGETGIIGKRQTWQWGWNYLVRNNRQQPVTVRLEDPAPQAGDKDITVSLEDKPEAQKGKENTLYWDVDVPAKGTASVRHAVTISAPQGMDVMPGR